MQFFQQTAEGSIRPGGIQPADDDEDEAEEEEKENEKKEENVRIKLRNYRKELLWQYLDWYKHGKDQNTNSEANPNISRQIQLQVKLETFGYCAKVCLFQ